MFDESTNLDTKKNKSVAAFVQRFVKTRQIN